MSWAIFIQIVVLVILAGVVALFLGAWNEVVNERKVRYETLHFDENTLHKVRLSLIVNGVPEEKTTDVISEMLSAGILFRERNRSNPK